MKCSVANHLRTLVVLDPLYSKAHTKVYDHSQPIMVAPPLVAEAKAAFFTLVAP